MIETDRLLLRRWTPADVDDFLELYRDPEVKRFLSVSDDFDRERAAARIAADEEEWAAGRRMLPIIERSSGRFLGRAALYYWPQFDETEVGWALRADARGQGFATEAARAVGTWGFENFTPPYLTAMIRPDNAPSMSVAERLGMSVLRDDLLSDRPVVVYSVAREAWRS